MNLTTLFLCLSSFYQTKLGVLCPSKPLCLCEGFQEVGCLTAFHLKKNMAACRIRAEAMEPVEWTEYKNGKLYRPLVLAHVPELGEVLPHFKSQANQSLSPPEKGCDPPVTCDPVVPCQPEKICEPVVTCQPEKICEPVVPCQPDKNCPDSEESEEEDKSLERCPSCICVAPAICASSVGCDCEDGPCEGQAACPAIGNGNIAMPSSDDSKRNNDDGGKRTS